MIYQIQRAVTDEIVSRNPRALLLTPDQRQKELLYFIKTAGRGGDIDFARMTLGKSLFAFMKVRCKTIQNIIFEMTDLLAERFHGRKSLIYDKNVGI